MEAIHHVKSPYDSPQIRSSVPRPGEGPLLVSAPHPVDCDEAYTPSSSLQAAAAVGMGLLALAGTARAAEAPPTAPAPSGVSVSRALEARSTSGEARDRGSSLSPSSSAPAPVRLDQIDHSHDGWRIDLDHTNDSMPNVMGVIPCDQTHDRCSQADDDGWTAGFRLNVVKTDGSTQWVAARSWDMVTQRGSYDPTHTGYQGLRQDIADAVLQRNIRTTLPGHPDVTLDYGVGGGLQLIGPMGGLQLQQTMHKTSGLFSGRLDASQGLQTHYTTDGVHGVPVVTGGAALTENLDRAGTYKLRESVQGELALGPGVSVLRAGVGVEAQPASWVKVSADVHLDAAKSTYAPLSYMPVDGVRPGWQVRADFQVSEHVQPYVGLVGGGVRGEPSFYVGVSIPLGGGGSHPDHARLDPIFR